MQLHTLFKLMTVASIVHLSACNGFFEGVRSVTYPPDFNYISQQKLTDTMQQFALYSTLLENNLKDPSTITEEQRQSSISILRKMEALSLKLGTETLSSNHDIVSFNIDKFRQNIQDARTGLMQDPPNYYRAGAVSAYCLNCHSTTKQ
jgi:ABC-type iron transport system FetAB ATPase subunit